MSRWRYGILACSLLTATTIITPGMAQDKFQFVPPSAAVPTQPPLSAQSQSNSDTRPPSQVQLPPGMPELPPGAEIREIKGPPDDNLVLPDDPQQGVNGRFFAARLNNNVNFRRTVVAMGKHAGWSVVWEGMWSDQSVPEGWYSDKPFLDALRDLTSSHASDWRVLVVPEKQTVVLHNMDDAVLAEPVRLVQDGIWWQFPHSDKRCVGSYYRFDMENGQYATLPLRADVPLPDWVVKGAETKVSPEFASWLKNADEKVRGILAENGAVSKELLDDLTARAPISISMRVEQVCVEAVRSTSRPAAAAVTTAPRQ